MRKQHRRKFLLASSALLATPLVSSAQPSQKLRRIGYLGLGRSPVQEARKPFSEGLRRRGYEEGKNLDTRRLFADWNVERLSALAEELVRLNVEVIVTWPNSATVAANRATRSIPIVMFASFLPVENRLIESLARPGGNVTGTSWWDGKDQSTKTFQILKDAAPRAKRLTVLWDPTIPEAHLYDDHVRTAAAMGLTMTRIGLSRLEDLSAALDQVKTSRPDIFLTGGGIINARFREIAEFAIRQKLISITTSPDYVSLGGLLYYGPDIDAMWDRTASYVDRILRGAKPSDLPVEHPTKFELVLNAKTARVIGFKPPQSFWARVERQIE